MTVIHYDEIDTPIGPLVVCAMEGELCNIEFGSFAEAEPALRRWFLQRAGTDELVHAPLELAEAVRQLREYFAGTRTSFDLSYKLYGTEFQRRVWEALAAIPYGETRSYKQIGESIGAPKAVRAVGGANNRNPLAIVIPCHRVIGANGAMVGYGGGLPIKQHLLSLEGKSGRAANLLE